MARYKVTLSTVVSVVAEVEAGDEDEASDAAFKIAKNWGSQLHRVSSMKAYVDVNNEWQYEDPEIKELG